jgi:hypothetical protein
MKLTEKVTVPFGIVERLAGDDHSAVLAQLPTSVYPDPEPACATCPAADWYLTAKHLRCFCKEHRVIAWVSDDDPVLACDARERLIEEAEANNHTGENVARSGR